MGESINKSDSNRQKSLCGLLLKLEKDILWAPHSGNDYILGYFDRISFSPVQDWLNFSPRTTAFKPEKSEKSGTCNTDANAQHYPLSTYPLKLLFPSDEMMAQLTDLGFNYKVWQQDIFEKKEVPWLDIYPCISVILVNLTDEFKGDIPRDPCGKQLRRFAQAICEETLLLKKEGQSEYVEEPSAPLLKRAHCCILPSLGYSDFCILLAEKEWSVAPMLVECLHRVACNGTPILSTDYVMPVYHVASKPDGEAELIRSSSNQYGIQLSIQIHLQPGVPVGMLEQVVKDYADVYQVSGSPDCLLVSRPETDFSPLLGMVLADHKEGVKIIKNLVVSTEAALQRQFSIPNKAWKHATLKPLLSRNSAIDNLRNTLKCRYWGLLKACKRHMRQFNAMWERITAIENICKEPHNATLQWVINPWLETFDICLKRCIDSLEAQKKAVDAVDEREKSELLKELWSDWKKTEDALEIFISQVGSFLADLSRSDCFFMESERYNHPSVSSATALLLAYNRWQNEFVQDVLKEEDNRSRYTFLVRSGGCDSTHTNNIFAFLVPHQDKGKTIEYNIRSEHVFGGEKGDTSVSYHPLLEHMPLITHMSEMSLFDCGGAVFRMTHECMHYCGARFRMARVYYIVKFTTRYFGRMLAYVLFSRINYRDHLIQKMRRAFLVHDAAVEDAIGKCWEKEVESLSSDIAVALESWIAEDYRAEPDGWDETTCMMDNFHQWLLEKLMNHFSWQTYENTQEENVSYWESSIVGMLYMNQLKAEKRFYNQCDDVIHKYGYKLNFCAMESRRVSEYIDIAVNKNKFEAANTKQMITVTLSCMMADPVFAGTDQGIFQKLYNYNLPGVLEKVVFDCFGEAYADIEACIRLHASLADYLLSFVFENWDIQNALPVDVPYAFRIPAVLRVFFPEMLDKGKTALSQDARDELKQALDSLVAHGMPECRRDEKSLSARVDELLQNYQRCHWEAEPLEEYLQMCKDKYERSDHTAMQKYQMAFEQIRLLSGDSGNNKATKVFTSLMTIGRGEGLGEKEQVPNM